MTHEERLLGETDSLLEGGVTSELVSGNQVQASFWHFIPAFSARTRAHALSGEELERWQRRWEQSIGPSTGSYNRPGGFAREKHFPSGNACAARLMICGVSTSKTYKNASVSHTPAREFSVSSMASQRLSSSPNF